MMELYLFLCAALLLFAFAGRRVKTGKRTYVSQLAMFSVVLLFSFGITGCQEQAESPTQQSADAQNTAQMPESDDDETKADTDATDAGGILGEGAKEFAFTVVDADGTKTEFEIHTDKETVGDALLELDLIAGEEGVYGLYVKTVNGITADYDKDKTYWAFYIDGEYAQTGVDQTEITAGASYAFQVEK